MTPRITAAHEGAALEAARALIREYADQLGVNLSFQGIDAELASLPGDYAPPAGALLVAWDGDTPAGCVGVRHLEPGVCELKRLYVRAAYRGAGLGRALAEAAVTAGRSLGYRVMRLDTLADMASARELYRALGFVPTAPYRVNPLPGAEFLALDLRSAEG